MKLDKEKKKEYMKKWYSEHKEERKEKKSEYDKKYNREHRKRNAERRREIYKQKTQEILAKGGKWYLENKERIANKNRKRMYGITPEEYQKMVDEQKGCCAICGRHSSVFKRGLSIDHNHKTKKVRKLLCPKCNLAIGHSDEDISILEKIIEYLKSFDE